MEAIELRRAGRDDADAISDVYLAAFSATYDFPLAHTDAEVRAWIGDVLIVDRDVWVATNPDGGVVGFLALGDDMLEQLYIAPGWSGHGIGSRLVALAKERRPDGLDLYTFQVNAGARRFYERHGFVEVSRGDGADNEEGQPDVRYSWRPGAGPLRLGLPGSTLAR